MSQQQDKPQGEQPPRALTGADLSGASVDTQTSPDGVGRQSGQQREHGHMSREDQERDDARASSGTDKLGGHPDTNSESVSQGVNGGTGQ